MRGPRSYRFVCCGCCCAPYVISTHCQADSLSLSFVCLVLVAAATSHMSPIIISGRHAAARFVQLDGCANLASIQWTSLNNRCKRSSPARLSRAPKHRSFSNHLPHFVARTIHMSIRAVHLFVCGMADMLLPLPLPRQCSCFSNYTLIVAVFIVAGAIAVVAAAPRMRTCKNCCV